jgi:hypothetical protein
MMKAAPTAVSRENVVERHTDLNKDGRKDAILTYFGSSYGDIDVTDKLVLAQCKDGTYIRLLEGKPTLSAPAMPHARGRNWKRRGIARRATVVQSAPRRSS